MTILVVDDSPDVQAVCRLALQRVGYEVLMAADGNEALRVAAACAREISAALIDLLLPDMNGMDLIDRLAESGVVHRFVCMSGYPIEEQRGRHATRQSCCYFLAKPFTPGQLVAMLAAVVHGDTGRGTP